VARSVFRFHDADGHILIGLFVRLDRTIRVFQVRQTDTLLMVSPVWQREVTAVVPVEATRNGLFDLLMLHLDGRLSLWCGYDLTLPLSFRAPEKGPSVFTVGLTSPRSYNMRTAHGETTSLRVNDLQTIYGPFVDLVLSSGLVWRAMLDLQPWTGLVNRCFQMLQALLPGSVAFSILRRFLLVRHSSLSKCDEWLDFAVTLLSFMNERYVLSGLERSEESLDDWEFLLNSSVHFEERHKFSSFSTRLPPRNIDKIGALAKEAEMIRDLDVEGSNNMVGQHFGLIAIGLHFVYENMKLLVAESTHCEYLCQLLLHLTCRLHWNNYVDYYVRDRPDFAPLVPAVSGLFRVEKCSRKQSFFHYTFHRMESIPFYALDIFALRLLICLGASRLHDTGGIPQQLWAKPVDIMHNLEAIMAGKQVENILLFDDLVQMTELSHSLSHKGKVCVETKLMINLYKILFHESFFNWEPALQTMCELGFQTKRSFAWYHPGVVAPLYQVLSLARETPASHWPLEAYMLIGMSLMSYFLNKV
jgi:hypothetical protein